MTDFEIAWRETKAVGGAGRYFWGAEGTFGKGLLKDRLGRDDRRRTDSQPCASAPQPLP